ncbi:RnfABCDGE type electron transport complex subunit D [Vibrio sp. FNV 38]|nr:RnfABCDGE type electron transport complex subunit D [Vibrio sp. FNV 38]
MINFQPQAGPYAHSSNSSTRIMYHVVLALLPTVIIAGLRFGPTAIHVVMVCILTAVLVELFCLLAQRKPLWDCLDGSAILTGLILALSLPPALPAEISILGTAFAIAVGKHSYGGLGQNIFNPAMLGRVFLLICFPVQMTQWSAPIDGTIESAAQWLNYDGVSAATLLSEHSNTISINDLLTGHQSGSLGEVHGLWLLLGGVYLLYKRIITPTIPCFFLLGIIIPASVGVAFQPESFLAPHVHVFSGGAMMAAFFIATDMVTSPSSTRGQVIYGVLGGFLVWMIREVGSYPEGVAFAILMVNGLTPLIDHYVQPVRFGSRITLTEDK